MNKLGIAVFSILIGASSILILNSEIRNLVGLLTGKYTDEIKKYRITKFSYAYFIFNAVVSIVFGVCAGVYYTLYLNGLFTSIIKEYFDLVAISIILLGITRTSRHFIDKNYLLEDDKNVAEQI